MTDRTHRTPGAAVRCIDTVIGGDVLRMVVEGAPPLRARSADEALAELRREHDNFRRFVTAPPRGYAGLIGCLLLPPFTRGAARTAVVAPGIGYVPIAATPLMAAAATLIAIDEVAMSAPTTQVTFDTASGPAAIDVNIADDKITSVAWQTTAPSILGREELNLTDGRRLPVTLVLPGLPYAVIQASSAEVGFNDTAALGETGAMVCQALNEQFPLQSFGLANVASQYHVMIIDEPVMQPAASIQVACVGQSGWVFNTPAGTGALSVAAHLRHLGQLDDGVLLENFTPTNGRLSCSIDDANAVVESGFEMVADLTLLGTP